MPNPTAMLARNRPGVERIRGGDPDCSRRIEACAGKPRHLRLLAESDVGVPDSNVVRSAAPDDVGERVTSAEALERAAARAEVPPPG